MGTGLLMLLVVTLFYQSHADPYGNAAPPPPPPLMEVAGKKFPQSYLCNDPTTKCFSIVIPCPKQCPSFKPSNPSKKACFVDCNSKNCEAICKKRRPNCNGIGAACYDPRFVGGDGIMFYFHGKSNQHFSVVSDYNLQINAHFIGRRPEGRARDNTWIQALGPLFDHHSFTLSANKVAQWDDEVDQLSLSYDGVSLLLPEGHLSTWTAPENSKFSVERTSRCNGMMVTLEGVFEISVNVVPVSKEDDRTHKYQIPSDDCFAHLEVQFKLLNLSEKVEGVLGQTYREDFENPVKRGVAMPIMGGEEKYKTSSLLSTDCNYCIFSSEAANLLVLDPAAVTLECTGTSGNTNGVVCRR